MNILAIICYFFSLLICASFFDFSNRAMILNAPNTKKLFLFSPLFDIFSFLVFGALIFPYYLFTYWISVHILKLFSTSKLLTKNSIMNFIAFIVAIYIVLLFVISAANPFMDTKYMVENVQSFFSNHVILTVGFYAVIIFISINNSGFVGTKIKSILFSFLIFSSLSLVSYGLFNLVLYFNPNLPVLVVISFIIILVSFKKLSTEMKSYIKKEPELGTDLPKIVLDDVQITGKSEFDGDISQIKKKRKFTSEPPKKTEYPFPTICPKCESSLTEQGFCTVCDKRLCPKCYSQLSKKSVLCTCGFIFDAPIKKEPMNQFPLEPEFESYEYLSDKKQIEENDDDMILESGQQNIPRICPYCQAIGWKDDICRCGYNYLTKTHPGQKK